jgi:hypothetical protein
MLVDKVWSFTTTIAPTVISTNPANNTTDINVNSVITATFSEGMNPLTVNSTTFILMQGITPVLGVVNYLDSVATFTPSASLELETSYTATITTGVTDIAGNMMVSNKVWTFTTSPIPDTTAPTIISVIPADSSTQISVTTKINATFSEEMKTQTINSTSFTLKQGTTPVSGIVSYTNLVACFTPSSNLAPNTVYTATILSTVQDVSGNTMVSNKVWTFTTSPVPDTTAPTVIQVTPENLAKNVSLATLISVTFSEEMDPLTITNTTFIVMQGATVVEGTFTYSEGTVVFTPTNPLKPNSIYSVNITTGVKDLAGNAMESDYIWVFTTGTDLDSRIPGFPLMITLLVGIGSIGLIAFSMKKKFD